MTREEKVNLLNELLEIEEKNDIGNLTSTDRREFQQWVEDLEQEPIIDKIRAEIAYEQVSFSIIVSICFSVGKCSKAACPSAWISY